MPLTADDILVGIAAVLILILNKPIAIWLDYGYRKTGLPERPDGSDVGWLRAGLVLAVVILLASRIALRLLGG